MTRRPDSRHRPSPRAAALLCAALAVSLLAGAAGRVSPARAGRITISLTDSLRGEIDRRLDRIAALRDSLARVREGDSSDAVVDSSTLAGIQEVVRELQDKVKDLELQIDDSSILLAGPTGRLRIDFPEEWGRCVGESLQEILQEIPVDTLQEGLRTLGAEARRLAREIARQQRPERETWHVVGEDWVRFGDDTVLQRKQRLTGDLVVLFADARVEGRVDGSAVVIGGTLTLGDRASVGEDAVAVVGHVVAAEGARIEGDTVDIGLPGGRAAEGEATDHGSPALAVFGQAALLMVLLLLAWLSLLLVPRDRLRAVERRLRESVGGALGVGALWTVAGHLLLLVVLAVLIATIVGIPLALLLMLAYVLFGLVAVAVVARQVGRLVCRRPCDASGEASWLVLPGLLVLSLPWIVSWPLHWLFPGSWAVVLLWSLALTVMVVVYALGTGAILRSRFGSR